VRIPLRNSVPKGRLKVVQDLQAAYFQPSLRDWVVFKSNPGLASWAKFSRPFGTEFRNGILTQTLKPVPTSRALIQRIGAVTPESSTHWIPVTPQM
jgi:hypothetical protein